MLNMIDTTQENNTSRVKVDSRVQDRLRVWLEDRIAAGKKKPVAEVVTLVPALAALLLEHNPVNRPLGRYNLDVLKADVANGRFTFNGESIVVADTGNLIDGQHRCETVLATGVPIETVIVFGPKETARYTIDIGKPKTAANFLAMKGWHDNNHLAATITLLLMYRSHGSVSHGINRPTKTEIINAIEQFKGIQDSVDFVSDATRKKLGSRSALAFCHYTFWKKCSRQASDEFISTMIEGSGLRKDSPIYYCRERLRDMTRGTRAETRIELLFRCWNIWRRGESVTKIPLSGNLPKLER
jgi:hypothetical protein